MNKNWAGRLLVVLFVLAAGMARAEVLVTYDLTHTVAATGEAERRRGWDEQHVVAGLQGLVNREGANLYVFMVGPGGGTDRFWLEYLRSPGHWLEKREVVEEKELKGLLARFRSYYKGVVVYDEKDVATSLVASTVAGVEGLLPVRYDPTAGSVYRELVEGMGLPVGLDLRTAIPPTAAGGSRKCDVTLWAVDRYLKTGKCDAGSLAYYPNAFGLTSGRAGMGRTLLCNHDYFIAHKAFFFDLGVWEDETPDDDRRQRLGEDLRTLQKVLAAAHEKTAGMIHVGGFTPWAQKYTEHTGGKHGGVETEWRFAEILSCFDAYMDADAAGLDAMANASVFQHFPLKEKYEQPNLPTEETLKAKGYLDAAGKVVPKNYAAIYVGDYDSAAWLYQELPGMWQDPNRGQVELGWAFNPALEKRFPVGLHYARENASPMDTFVAGDSGYGYLNPGLLVGDRKWSRLGSGLDRWEKLCTEGYRRWGISVTGFVIDGNGPGMSGEVKAAYARFSPGGVVAQKVKHRETVSRVPFLRINADLEKGEESVPQVVGAFPEKGTAKARFEMFRTILWTPTRQRKLVEGVRRERPDIEFVGPYELFELMKRGD